MLTTLLPIDRDRLNSSDQTIILSDMLWQDFEILVAQESPHYKVSFYDGIITIVSPSQNHEIIERTISILINAYCRHNALLYFALGSTTLKRPPLAGKEPDTSYSFNSRKATPDLAVEVIYSSGNVEDSLNKYKYLGVKEVWFWRQQEMRFYQLQNEKDGYKEINLSNYLQLSPKFLVSFVNRGLQESPLTIENDFVRQLKN